MRTYRLALLIALLAFTGVPIPVMGCSIQTPAFDPSTFKSGVILEGVVEVSRLDGGMIDVDLRVERVVQGPYHRSNFTFSFFPSLNSGSCAPPGTQIVGHGKKLVVYLSRMDGGLWRKAWLSFEDAKRLDYRVRIPARSDAP